MKHLLCSFGGSGNRGWTDVATAHTHMPVLGPWFARELLESKLPHDVLPMVFHEVTHHACLNTPVGLALSLIAHESGDESLPEELRKLLQLRLDLVLGACQPWLEGLAMFAEFDVTTGSADVLSSATAHTLLLFGNYTYSENRDASAVYSDFFATLDRYRESELAVERKIDLLSSLWSKEGYLSGYLAVKEFSYAAEQMAPQYFGDKDFVLNYLLHYLFHDVTLVRLLLSAASDKSVPEALIAHLSARTKRILRDGPELVPEAREWETRMLSREGRDLSAVPVEAADQVEADDLIEAMDCRVAELPQSTVMSMGRRPLIHLCDARVVFQLSDAGALQVLAEDGALLLSSMNADALGSEIPGSGTIEMYLDTATWTTFLVVLNPDQTVLFLEANGDAGEREIDMLQLIEDAPPAVAQLQAMESSSERLLHSDDVSEVSRRRLLELSQSIFDASLADLALLWVPEDARQHMVAYLQLHPIADFLSEEQLLALCLLSLIDCRGGYLEEVDASAFGIDSLAIASDSLRETFWTHCGGWPLRLRAVDEGAEGAGTRVYSLL